MSSHFLKQIAQVVEFWCVSTLPDYMYSCQVGWDIFLDKFILGQGVFFGQRSPRGKLINHPVRESCEAEILWVNRKIWFLLWSRSEWREVEPRNVKTKNPSSQILKKNFHRFLLGWRKSIKCNWKIFVRWRAQRNIRLNQRSAIIFAISTNILGLETLDTWDCKWWH